MSALLSRQAEYKQYHQMLTYYADSGCWLQAEDFQAVDSPGVLHLHPLPFCEGAAGEHGCRQNLLQVCAHFPLKVC